MQSSFASNNHSQFNCTYMIARLIPIDKAIKREALSVHRNIYQKISDQLFGESFIQTGMKISIAEQTDKAAKISNLFEHYTEELLKVLNEENRNLARETISRYKFINSNAKRFTAGFRNSDELEVYLKGPKELEGTFLELIIKSHEVMHLVNYLLLRQSGLEKVKIGTYFRSESARFLDESIAMFAESKMIQMIPLHMRQQELLTLDFKDYKRPIRNMFQRQISGNFDNSIEYIFNEHRHHRHHRYSFANVLLIYNLEPVMYFVGIGTLSYLIIDGFNTLFEVHDKLFKK
jgi:hypothetical protein